MANDVLLNTTTDLNGKTLVTAEGDRSITGLLTYSRGASAPFGVGAGAANVANLDADKVDGQHAPTGTIVGTTDAQVLTNKTLTAPVINGSISGSPAVFNKVVITAVGVQNDYAPGLVGNTWILANNASLLTIQGIAGGYDGQVIRISSVGAGQVDLAPQNTGSAAANRLINFAGSSGTLASTSLAAGVGYAEYIYDGTNSRWRMVLHEQGAWITPTFAAGNYTGSGGWTVTGGGITTQAYLLRGRSLTVAWYIASTTVVAGSLLNIGNGAWGGFTAAKTMLNAAFANNNSGGNESGAAQVSTNVVQLLRTAGANWSNATTATNVFGQIDFEVL